MLLKKQEKSGDLLQIKVKDYGTFINHTPATCRMLKV